MPTTDFWLPYSPPLDWQSLLDYFIRHPHFGVETIANGTYSRNFAIGSETGRFVVTNDAKQRALKLTISATSPIVTEEVRRRVRRMFDLEADPTRIQQSINQFKSLNPILKKYPGQRIACGFDPFESAISVILGQLVSTQQATRLIKQLIESCGQRIDGDAYLFPTPQALATADMEAVRTSPKRRSAINSLSYQIIAGKLNLEAEYLNGTLREALLAIDGIGAWSVENIELRGFGNKDAFPKTDLLIKRALELHSDVDLKSLKPFRGYVAIYLWRHYSGILSKQK